MENSLLSKDRKYVWHPFTQEKTAALPVPIVRGKGAYLFTENGDAYLDAISSWWVNLHGHCHPYIIQKISEQAENLEHVIFAGFTHQPAIELAERLIQLLNFKGGRVYYSDNGSTSVEVALKMALQYWHRHAPKKNKVISFHRAYHGDSFGAMAASGKSEFHRPFWPFLFEVEKIDPPYVGREKISIQQLQDLVEKGDVACFIFEPIIQGSSGMSIHSAQGLDALLALCKKHGVITIADEVMTGFGRTGPLFATERLRFQPDIICLSKGLTGGFLPLGATVCQEFIYDGFLSDKLEDALLHAHSYTANPLACSAALASLDLLLDDACTAQRKAIESLHRSFSDEFSGHPALKRCETLGTILVVDFKDSTSSYFSPLSGSLKEFFHKHKVLVRPLGSVLYLMPPYCIASNDLQKIYQLIRITLKV